MKNPAGLSISTLIVDPAVTAATMGKLIAQRDLPDEDIHYSETHIRRMEERGDFPPHVKLSPRKKVRSLEVVRAWKSVKLAGLEWRDWTAAARPVAEVHAWINETLAALVNPRKKSRG